MKKEKLILNDKVKFIELNDENQMEIIGGNNSGITKIIDKFLIFYNNLFND